MRAQAQVDTCTECASLHAELVGLASATRPLPAIQRPRDFQLRPEDAQRLRPNRIRRLFGSFGTARDGFSRPLALGLTTLGLAGLLFGVLPGTLSFGGAASAPGGPAAGSAPQQEIQQTLGAAAAASAAPAAPAAGGAPAQPGASAPAARPARAAAGREPAAGSGPGLRQRRRGGRHPGTNSCGHVQPARRRRGRSGPHLALRGFDRRLGADRRLGDAAHHRARSVRPALDLAPLRRLTTGRPTASTTSRRGSDRRRRLARPAAVPTTDRRRDPPSGHVARDRLRPADGTS